MKSVDAIQEVQFLPGQRLATSPVAKLVGRRRQRSEAGRSKSVGSVLSLESCLKVVVPYGISRGGLPDLLCANADSFSVLERSILPGVTVSRARDHRGLRPGHVDTRIARELGRASSASCPGNRGSMRRKPLCGSPPRDQSSPPERPAAPPGRSLVCNQKRKRTGTEGRAG